MNMQNDQPRFILTMEGPSVRGQVTERRVFVNGLRTVILR